MLRLQSVAMSYDRGREVLREIDLTLGAGEFVFLMGPSASGKTSLLRLMGLMRMPSSGRFSLFERDVASLAPSEIGALRIGGGRDEQVGAVVAEMTGWLGLAELTDVLPSHLSMAQRQLVAVARAVIARPGLLLCDEPTGHVDDKLARRVIHLLTQFCKLGSTVVLATHDHDLVDRHPHPVLRMSQGRLSRSAAVPPPMAAD